MTTPTRCPWATSDAMIAYHDREWGVPARDDRALFELLTLEGAQAGLSWATILRKRDRYREVYEGFDPEAIARFDRRRIETLLADPRIVRNRLKVEASVRNAGAILTLRERTGGSFADYIWAFVGGEPVDNRPRTAQDVPSETETSKAMSKDLKRNGFAFVGPTVCYAFMQAAGLVNDHLRSCAAREAVAR